MSIWATYSCPLLSYWCPGNSKAGREQLPYPLQSCCSSQHPQDYGSFPSLLMFFSPFFFCLHWAQPIEVYKGCLTDNPPVFSYVRLTTFLQRTCTKIKPPFRVSNWIIENKQLFFIYRVVLCWVNLPPAAYPKAQCMPKPPLKKTFFLSSWLYT